MKYLGVIFPQAQSVGILVRGLQTYRALSFSTQTHASESCMKLKYWIGDSTSEMKCCYC